MEILLLLVGIGLVVWAATALVRDVRAERTIDAPPPLAFEPPPPVRTAQDTWPSWAEEPTHEDPVKFQPMTHVAGVDLELPKKKKPAPKKTGKKKAPGGAAKKPRLKGRTSRRSA